MEKLLEEFVELIANRVVAKLTDQNSTWLNAIKYKVDAHNINGLTEVVEEIVNDSIDMGAIKDEARDAAKDVAEDIAAEVIKNANFEVSVSI